MEGLGAAGGPKRTWPSDVRTHPDFVLPPAPLSPGVNGRPVRLPRELALKRIVVGAGGGGLWDLQPATPWGVVGKVGRQVQEG